MSEEIKKILPVIFLLAAIGLGWLSWDTYSGISAVQNEVKASEDKIASLSTAVEKVNKFASFAKENPEAVNKLNIILPDDSKKPNMVSSLASASFANGLLLKKISFGDASNAQAVYGGTEDQGAANGKYKTQAISLSFSGTYSSLKNFLVFAEKNLKLTDVASIDFESAETAGEKPQIASYDFSVKLKTYYLDRTNNISRELKILAADKLNSLSFVQGKQFMDLVSPENYNIDTTDTGDWGNKNIF